MTRKKVDPPSVTSAETEEWYTAGDAAKVLTANSGKTIEPDYLFKLGKLGKIRTKKLTARLTLYYRTDVDIYKVEPRGTRSGQAKREKYGKEGPTVRETRKASNNDAA